MKDSMQEMNLKRIDYERFSITLIILSIYFYIGAIITTYIEPASNSQILFFLACIALLFVVYFFYKRQQIIKQLDNEEHMD